MTKSAKPAQRSSRDYDTGTDSVGLIAWKYRHELRRSSAAQPHVNKKRYTRKWKHTTRGDRDAR
ncbi:hypothetical protein [Mycolicibacterium vanbaalenii]|jgi:hypothetical protein|uniref:hypothetical protein n=1 Tax=Mycolicibacterium vanbaalenii TaxID=110539 RepID=UPI000315167F|nr:hypothetical protein [Mycolicibacterium vanbaalenii]MCV7126959.1 hypothetical protein [Mycolicibacterium vanbaalenii PYR-1]